MSLIPDVGVTLSVKGTQLVVDAFRKVQAEAQATARKSAQSFGGQLGQLFGQLKGFAAELGIAIGAIALAKELATIAIEGVDAGEALTHLAQKVSDTRENTAGLALAARVAGVDVKALAKGVDGLDLQVSKLRAGDSKATSLFARVGLSAADFDGTGSARNLEVFSKALDQFADSDEKAAFASQVLSSKLGPELLPLIALLGQEGLAKFIQLGTAMSEAFRPDILRNIAQAAEDLKEFGAIVDGAKIEFAGAFVAPFIEQFDAIKRVIGENQEAWLFWGKVTGRILSDVVALLVTVLDGVLSVTQALKDLRLNDPSQKKSRADITAFLDRAAALFNAPYDVPDGAKAPAAKKKPFPGAGDDRKNALKDQVDAEIEAIRQAAKTRELVDKIAFENGKLDVQAYYADRLRIVQQATAAEIAQREKLIAAGVDVSANKKAIVTLKGQLQDTTLVIGQEMDKEKKKLADSAVDLIQATLKAEGDELAITLQDIDKHAAEFRASLHSQTPAGSAGRAKADADVDNFVRVARAAAEFTANQKIANEVLKDFQDEEAAVADEFSRGEISLGSAEQRLDAIRSRAQTVMTAYIAKLREFAAAAHNADLGRLADDLERSNKEFQQGTKALTVFQEEVGQAGINVKRALGDSLSSALAQVGTTITTVGGFVDSFLEGLAQALEQILAKLVAYGILQSIGLPVPKADGGPVKRADGGPVRGPGGPRSDSIPAMLSDGEFVVNARAMKQPGVAPVVDHINRTGQLPPPLIGMRAFRFADGGAVSVARAAAASRSQGIPVREVGEGGAVGGTITVVTEPGTKASVSQRDEERRIAKLVVKQKAAIKAGWGES